MISSSSALHAKSNLNSNSNETQARQEHYVDAKIPCNMCNVGHQLVCCLSLWLQGEVGKGIELYLCFMAEGLSKK